MILIADCGSTKIDWCVVRDGKVEKQVFTCGMNAVMLTEEEMRTRIASELVPDLGKDLNDYLCGKWQNVTVNPPPRTIVKPKKKGLGL